MTQQYKPVVWSIAGSDNSGGAGIQADNQVFQAFGCHAGNIVTAITAQNSKGVSSVHLASRVVFDKQWLTLRQELPAEVIKLGMLGSADIVEALMAKLAIFDGTVVCDPVLTASAGGSLMDKPQSYLPLLDHVDVLLPNQQEFVTLFGPDAASQLELERQALQISKAYRLDLIITGGENRFSDDVASDLCVMDGEIFWMHSPRNTTHNTHGTGCSFSSAFAAALACGYEKVDACVLAKAYLNQALAQPALFRGERGALQHAGFPAAIRYLPHISRTCEVKIPCFPVIKERLGIYPVVNSIDWLQKCLAEGVKTIQLRVKNMEPQALDTMVQQAAALGHEYNARLFINDYWQLAIKHNAYGVHLGQEDLDEADIVAIADAGLHLGVSTHSWFEIARAHSLQPSYIAIGPIYETTTKQMRFAPQGLTQLAQWVRMIGGEYPLVAIGGIDLTNAGAVLATGVGSVAMVRAVTDAADYRHAIARFQQLHIEAP